VPATNLAPFDWFELLLGDTTQPLTDTPSPGERGSAAYRARIRAEQRNTDSPESLRVTGGTLAGHPVVCAAFDFRFLGGTLGYASGQILTHALEQGTRCHGVVVIVASGGLRVQEGLDALLQIPGVMAARQMLAQSKRPLIVVATDPTMGGVAASIVATADIVLAEPGTRFGLSGPRAAQAMGYTAHIETAEQALEAGLIDQVVARDDLADRIGNLLHALAPQG
jgi:acetyl-CoA carboxylase beta subunit